jgi:hypothetical protein
MLHTDDKAHQVETRFFDVLLELLIIEWGEENGDSPFSCGIKSEHMLLVNSVVDGAFTAMPVETFMKVSTSWSQGIIENMRKLTSEVAKTKLQATLVRFWPFMFDRYAKIKGIEFDRGTIEAQAQLMLDRKRDKYNNN